MLSLVTITCKRQSNFAGWSIIGVMTHVYLSDAVQRYGMYIEWMLDRSNALTEGNLAA